MIELLAVPGWQTPPTTLEVWSSHLQTAGCLISVTRESTGVSWIECTRYRFRGYAVMNGNDVEAVNFELSALDPLPATRLIESVAQELGWELHPDDPDDEAEDDDDD